MSIIASFVGLLFGYIMFRRVLFEISSGLHKGVATKLSCTILGICAIMCIGLLISSSISIITDIATVLEGLL